MSAMRAYRQAERMRQRRIYAASTMTELRGELMEARWKADMYGPGSKHESPHLCAYFWAEVGMIRTAIAVRVARMEAWEPSFDKMEPNGPGR